MTDQVTGEQLYQELCNAAAAARKSLAAFAAPLFPASWKIEQMRIARQPKPTTVKLVRALIAGEPLPPRGGRYIRDPRALGLTRLAAEEAGIPPSQRSQYEQHLLGRAAEMKAEVERRRSLSEQAHLTRRPGQTLADAVRELQA